MNDYQKAIIENREHFKKQLAKRQAEQKAVTPLQSDYARIIHLLPTRI